MSQFNIFLTGVGGQGIGLISEAILRAADHAQQPVKSVDTHGLAQRGGIVVSQIRIGASIHTPIIPEGEADLVVALERHEALRGMNTALKDKGTLIYYDTVQQPLETRLNRMGETTQAQISETCGKRGIKEVIVRTEEDLDPRMQNMVLLREINRHQLVPGIKAKHYQEAIKDLLAGAVLEKNLELFNMTPARS